LNNLAQDHLHHHASSAYSVIASTSFPGRPEPSILIDCYSEGSLMTEKESTMETDVRMSLAQRPGIATDYQWCDGQAG